MKKAITDYDYNDILGSNLLKYEIKYTFVAPQAMFKIFYKKMKKKRIQQIINFYLGYYPMRY